MHQISLSMGDYAKMMETAEQIRDAVLESENTAVKVGGLLVDMLALIDKVMPDGWVDESGVVITWRGVWSNLERYFNGTTIREETGKRERSCVLYYGCQWLCNVNGTKEPPNWDSPDWDLFLGNPDMMVTLVTDCDAVDVDDPRITIEASASILNQDISDSLRICWDWTRETIHEGVQDKASDDLWDKAHANCGMRTMTLLKSDMNYAFGKPPETCIFTVTASIIADTGEIVELKGKKLVASKRISI